MKVGSIVLATHQGLGYLAKSFYDNGIINRVYIKDHSSRKNNYHWYRPEDIVGSPDELLDCDALIFFEEVFDWKIIPKAREQNVKTILMPMYECTRNPLPYVPDMVICPSLLDMQYFREYHPVFMTVPVKENWKLRQKARVFVHNGGNLGLGGRNGTQEVLSAMEYVKSPVRLLVRSQVPINGPSDDRIEYQTGQFPKKDLYDTGDVFIFPEKFNGLSLPLQEAFASGMMVMAGDRFPMTSWLPQQPLIPVDYITRERIAVEFEYSHYDPKVIAKHIDYWYNKDITKYSLMGRKFQLKNSWYKMRKKYLGVIKELCNTTDT